MPSSASTAIGNLRAGMVDQYWKYLDRSFDLEADSSAVALNIQPSEIMQDWEQLNLSLKHSDPITRGAIASVFNFELRNLIMRCKLEAEHLGPLKRVNRLSRIRDT